MLICNKNKDDKINFKGIEITCNNNQKLFGSLIDIKLSFDARIKPL